MNKTHWSDETPNEGEPQMLQVPIVDNEVQQFLSILHSLLIEGRYGWVRAALLVGLYVQLESDAAEKGVIDLGSLREGIDALASVDKQELEETSWLAYLAGRQARIVDDIPLREQAELFIEVLGLQELMRFNLSLGKDETGTGE